MNSVLKKIKRGIKWRYIKLYHKIYPDHPVKTRLSFGYRFYCNNDWIGQSIFTGVFDLKETEILHQLVQDDWNILDIGANTGYYTLLFSRLSGGKIIAFEPSKRERKQLLNHLKINKIKNVTVEEYAVGSSEKTINLFISDINSAINTIYPEEQNVYASTMPVKMIRLDQYISSSNINKVDLIKIDVEGAELEVLTGATETIRNFRPVILFEDWRSYNKLWKEGVKQSPVIQLLQDKKYSFLAFINGNLSELIDDTFVATNNIFAVPEENKDIFIVH